MKNIFAALVIVTVVFGIADTFPLETPVVQQTVEQR